MATATIGRQLRMGATEHEALTKAAGQGEQNTYIMNALRKQLRRDGHLPDDDKQPRLPLRGKGTRRRRTAK